MSLQDQTGDTVTLGDKLSSQYFYSVWPSGEGEGGGDECHHSRWGILIKVSNLLVNSHHS